MRDQTRGPIPILLMGVLLLAGCGVSQASLAPASSVSLTTPSFTASAAVSPTPTPVTTPIPTPKRTPAATASTGASASDLYGLASATLDLPTRAADMEGCAQGPRTKFVKGRSGKTTRIADAVEADLDHDGAPEVVAFIDCSPPGWGENPPRQVVAFERRADGTFATMGVVVEEVPAGDPRQNDDTIEDVSRIEAAPNGGIRIEVGDPATLYQDTGTSPGLYQQRTYGWNGTTFVQIAGSTSCTTKMHAHSSATMTSERD